ncbi:MAG: hypothetical protein WB779_14645 [Ignavibacteriaceae bacterium]
MKKFFVFFILFSSAAFCKLQFSGISSTPGAFSRMGFGARGMGMGNAMSAVTEGNLVTYYNPALSVFQEKMLFQTSYSILSLDRSLNFINFTARFDIHPYGENSYDEKRIKPVSSAGVSIGLINSGVSNISARDNEGVETGTISTSENLIFISLAKTFSSKLAIGLTTKFYFYNLAEGLKASGLGFDLGALYILNDNFNIAAVISDINSKYKWDSTPLLGQDGKTTEDSFPLLKRIGLSYRNKDYKILASAEFENSNAGTNILRFGVEYNIIEQLYIRGGIDNFNLSNSDFPKRPSIGFSYFKSLGGDWIIGVDYAFVIEKYSPEDRHIIGVNVRF